MEDLGEQARRAHDKIVNGEQTLAPVYWELGRILKLARKQLGRGQWGRFLASFGINRVRACKALAIYDAFTSPDDLVGMSVEESYEHRRRRQAGTSHAQSAKCRTAAVQPDNDEKPQRNLSEADLETYLAQVCDQAERLIDVAAFLEKDRRELLYPRYRAALEQLQYLGRMLGAEDKSPTGDEPFPKPGESACRKKGQPDRASRSSPALEDSEGILS